MALKIATPAVVSVTICHVSDNDIRIINNLPRGHPRASVGQVIVFRGLPTRHETDTSKTARLGRPQKTVTCPTFQEPFLP
jgi:hypothetical protein